MGPALCLSASRDAEAAESCRFEEVDMCSIADPREKCACAGPALPPLQDP